MSVSLDVGGPRRGGVAEDGLLDHRGGLALQTAAIYNHAGEATGLQLAAALNRTERMRGLQIALVNWTDDLDGVQIGLININRNGWIPFLPLFNFGF